MNAISQINVAACKAVDDSIARAADELIERYRRGLTVTIEHGRDEWVREDARQCLAKVEAHAKRIEAGAMFAADSAMMFLGPNMAGPRIDVAIAAGERRAVKRVLAGSAREPLKLKGADA